MSTYTRSVKIAVPTTDVTEWLLYILARHETDALREMVLPINEPAGKIVFVQYHNERLALRFLHSSHSTMETKPRYKQETVFRNLVKERGWFFRWEGAGVGIVRISREDAALLAYHCCHADRKSSIYMSRLVDQSLIQLADKHLYAPITEGQSHVAQ